MKLTIEGRMSFTDLSLGAETLKGLLAAGFTDPTPIQRDVIPLALAGRDVFGCAQTGTGKTGSFVVPILERLQRGRSRARMPRVLVLAPTRELAYQVSDSFHKLGAHHAIKTVVAIGGESMVLQEKALSVGVDIIIATPGRLLDLFERGKILLHALEMLVIDEVDRMLDMGFVPEIEKIVKFLPVKRQTLVFSATVPDEIRQLSRRFLTNPAEVTVAATSKAADTIVQYAVPLGDHGKCDVLLSLLKKYDVQNAIIFCNRKRDIGTVVTFLQRSHYRVASLHGDMTQVARLAALESFKGGETPFLVASDIAARGLDVEDLPFVFNYDIPTVAEEYVHRIGRTGRAGRTGQAFTLVGVRDKKALQAIETLIGHGLTFLEVGTTKSPDAEKGKDAQQDHPKAKKRQGKTKEAAKSKAAQENPTASDLGATVPPDAHGTIDDVAAPSSLGDTRPSGPKGRRRPSDSDKTDGAKGSKQSTLGFGTDVPAFMHVYFPDLPQ